jgi:hypothetical protein
MSGSGGSGSWMDRNWFWLVISFGAVCVAAIDFWHPHW